MAIAGTLFSFREWALNQLSGIPKKAQTNAAGGSKAGGRECRRGSIDESERPILVFLPVFDLSRISRIHQALK